MTLGKRPKTQKEPKGKKKVIRRGNVDGGK